MELTEAICAKDQAYLLYPSLQSITDADCTIQHVCCRPPPPPQAEIEIF